MKRFVILPFLLITATAFVQAQSLTDGTIATFCLDSDRLTGVGGEAGVYPVGESVGLLPGFIEILLLNQSGGNIPSAEVVDITSTTAVIRWEKIEGATAYTLNLYDQEQTRQIATYSLDENGQLRAESAVIDFSLTELNEDTGYYVEVVASQGDDRIASQSLFMKTSGHATGNETIDDTKVYTRDQYLFVEVSSPCWLSVIHASGTVVANRRIESAYRQTLSSGVYMVILRNNDSKKSYKVLVR